MRLTSTMAIALLALASLTGCGSGDDASATAPLTSSVTPSGSATPSVTGTPSTAADPSAITTSYPKLGLAFDNLPHATGAKQVALETWTGFEAAARRTTTSVTFDPAVSRFGTDDVVTGIHNSVAYLTQHHQRQAGTLREEFTRWVGANDRLVVFDACYDGSDGWLASTDGSGKRSPLDPPTSAVRVQVSNIVGAWKVTSITEKGTSC